MRFRSNRRVICRENNIVRVDFGREPDPPAPGFPGAGALRAVHGQADHDAASLATAPIAA